MDKYCSDTGRAGSGPDRLFWEMLRYVREVNCVIAGGNVPAIDAVLAKEIFVTWWLVVSHVTPCQLHHGGVPVPAYTHEVLPVFAHGVPATAAAQRQERKKVRM